MRWQNFDNVVNSAVHNVTFDTDVAVFLVGRWAVDSIMDNEWMS